MFDKNTVEQFYNSYGIREWERLDSTAYGKLMFLLNTDFLNAFIGKGKKVLDAGCGAGRFSIYIAKAKSQVTLLDLSETQLNIARLKCEEANITNYIEGYLHGSVTDMNCIPDNTFDTVVCFGAVLNYLHDAVTKAISELIRVTKSGGEILISVNNRNGVFRTMAIREQVNAGFISSFWGHPEEFGIYNMLNTGYEPVDYPGKKQPQRHFYNVDEIKELFNRRELTDISFGAVPCIITGSVNNAELFYNDKIAWDTLVDLEKSLYQNDTVLDAGEFLLARATVK